ncbi:MAG TPA: hypothetical protein H9788_13860 [Candidatus Brevibacterium intestinavium]|jgi:hypothetical protein|uniref:hypothetical protein n=1 Tax=Brevibacterium sp. TaxID=1701 RepID=UPI001F9AB8A5|nr:hypothetical protein [Brevibacterium sp.]HJA62166.1 hypothetical protein [Candidatus Brevibacterium intestinavium]
MTSDNDFNDDDNDFENSADDPADKTGEASGGFSDAPGSSEADDGSSGADDDQAGGRGPSIDRAGDDDGTADGSGPADSGDRADVDLPQLLRQVSHVLGREFRAAAADGGFDPRDFGRGRRGRRGWDHDEAVVDGAPVPEEPVSWGPAWGRGGRGPIGDVSPEEFRRRMRDLRDGIGSKVEEVLSSEEFEELKASLSKIVDAFGPDRCGGESDGHDHGARHDRPGPRGQGRRDEDPRDRSDRDGRPSGGGRGDHHGGGRGRRGFGPGFGAGRRGFDPFGWGDDRRSREREVQEAFERGFAAGFEQGRNA